MEEYNLQEQSLGLEESGGDLAPIANPASFSGEREVDQ